MRFGEGFLSYKWMLISYNSAVSLFTQTSYLLFLFLILLGIIRPKHVLAILRKQHCFSVLESDIIWRWWRCLASLYSKNTVNTECILLINCAIWLFWALNTAGYYCTRVRLQCHASIHHIIPLWISKWMEFLQECFAKWINIDSVYIL